MYKCVNVDSLNDEFITKKDSLNNLNVKERSSGRTGKSYYGKNDADHMMQNAEKNYLDRFDTPNGNLNKNYLYCGDNLMDEDSSKNSDLHSKTLEEHLKSYSYHHVDPEYILSNKYGSSQVRVDGSHLISLSDQRNIILSKERIHNRYFSKSYDNRSDGNRSDGHRSDGHKSDGHKSDGHKSDGNKNNDQIVNMISNHYNNLIQTTNKGIENINSNCDAIISKHNYDSMSDVSSTILMNKNDITQNNDYADYNYNSYFNYRNDHTSAHHYNGSANNGGQNNGSSSGRINGSSTGRIHGSSAGHNKRHSNGCSSRSLRSRNGNYEAEKRECFPYAHESSLNENLIHDNCDYAKVGKAELVMRDNEMNSLSVYNDEDAQNRILQEMDEQTKQGDLHFSNRLQSIERENTNNRIKIYDMFNNLNIKKSNNTNMGILNFLKNKRKNKYAYDSKGIRNDAAENKAPSKESHSSGVASKAGGTTVNDHAANDHNAGSANPSGHNIAEGSHSSYRFNANMRNVECNDPYNSSPVLKGHTYNEEEAKNKPATPHHILIDQKYIEENEEKLSKAELANKSNISSFETLKLLEKDNNGDVTNFYRSALNEFLNKKDSRSDECSNKADSAKMKQNNPFSVYHYVKKERAENAAPLPNGKEKCSSHKSGSTASKGNEKCNINGGSSKSNQNRNNVERNCNAIHSQRVDNHNSGNELPPRGEKTNKKGPTQRDAATNSNDNYSVGKNGLYIFKTGSEVPSSSFNHYSKKGTKKDPFDREHKMDVKRNKPDKDQHYFKEGLETDGEFPFNAKWNENDTFYLHEENKKNEKIKTNEELSSKYISSYSESSLPSSMQSFVEPKNRVAQKSRNSKNALTKEVKNRSEKKCNAKRKMNLKGKQENGQFHRSSSNSLIDDISCIYEDAKQFNFIDGIDGNRVSRNDACRHNVNHSANCNNANKSNKGVGTDARIPGHVHSCDEAKAPLQQNKCKHECRNAPTVYVKKKKKKKKKKHNGSDRYTESGSDRGAASSRDEDGGNNDCKKSLKGEDSSVKNKHRRSSSPNVNHSDPRNGVERGSKKYPGEHNALKELSADKGGDHYGDRERGSARDDAHDPLVASKAAHSMNPFRHDVATNQNEADSGANKGDRGSNKGDSSDDEDDGYNNRDSGDRRGKANGRGRAKNGNANTLEKSQIAQECNENSVAMKKEKKKKKKEDPLKTKQTMAQDEDNAHGDDTNVVVKCKMKKKSSHIISDYEQRACSVRENVPGSKTHSVAACKKEHQTKENTSKKSARKKGANQSSSSFNSSSSENHEKDEIECDSKTVPRKSARLKESNVKKTHRTPLHSNTASIRNSRGTNTGNGYNSQSPSSNRRSGMSDISSSGDDSDEGESQSVKAKTGKNKNSHFSSSGKMELKFCSDQEANQRCRREREASGNGTENRDSDEDSNAAEQNRAVSKVERDSHLTNSVAKKKRQGNLAKSKNDKREDLSTGEDNTDCGNLKEKRKKTKRCPSTGCSNNPTDGDTKLVYNPNGNLTAQCDGRRAVKKGGTPDGDEQICANMHHESEHFYSNANDVAMNGMRGENMCTRDTHIEGAHMNDPRMSYWDISIANYKTHSSKNSMGSIDNPASVGSLSKKKMDIQLVTQSEENFGDVPQERYCTMRCAPAPLGGGNLNHMDAHLKNIPSGNNAKRNAKSNAANLINGNEFAHQRVDCQNEEFKNLIMTGDAASCGEKVPPMEDQRMGRHLVRESFKQKAPLFYEKDGKLDDIFTHSNKEELLRNSKRMLNRTFSNGDPPSGHIPHKEHRTKEVPSMDNPFKRTEYIKHGIKTEDYPNRSSNMSNEDIPYNGIYEKEAGIFLKDSVSSQWSRKPDTLLTAQRRKRNDEGVNVSLNTNAGVNMNYIHEDPRAYQSKNAYIREEQIFPGKFTQGKNYNGALCKNRFNDDRRDELLHEKGKSDLFSSRGQEVDHIYKRDSISNAQFMSRGAPAHVAKSVQSTHHVFVNNATQEQPQRMGDPGGIIYNPVEADTNVNSYTPHLNFFQKEAKAAQRGIEKNPFFLHSHIKSTNMDGGINFYKTEEKDTMGVTPPMDRTSQKKEYDASRMNLFNKALHINVNGEQSDWFARKTDLEQNAGESKRTNNMEGGIGAKGTYHWGDPNDERSLGYMHRGGAAPFPDIYPGSGGRYGSGVNGVDAQNGNGLFPRHGRDTTIHGIRKNNDSNSGNRGNRGGDNGGPFDRGTNIHVGSAPSDADKRAAHANSQVAYSELESAIILNEVLRKDSESWNKPYSGTNKIPTLRFTNNFSIDFANILKNYKDKSDNYLNKQYIQDLERINFLIQNFTNSYRCSDNLKSIFQLLQYEIEKEKRENQYFCQDQKYLVLTMPLNDIKKNYDHFGEPILKEPICEYKLDTCLLENLENQSKGESCSWGRDHLKGDPTKACNLVKNCSRGDGPNYDGSEYGANDKCVQKCTTGNCRGLCMRAPSWASSPNSTTDVATASASAVVRAYSNSSGCGKLVRANRCAGNLPKTDKPGKHCISKKRCGGTLNESILSKMNTFIIRHNNRVYKLKLNGNFPLRGNQLSTKKNGKLFKLLSSFYKPFFKEEYNKRNVLLNEDLPLSYVHNVNPSRDSLSQDQTDNNGIVKSSHTHNDDNFYNIIQSSGLTNIDDLFISDDEVNLIYMYNNHRNEKVYSLEKLDVLKNQNSTLSSLNDSANTGQENYSCKK
ncbi:protein KIC9, putative [Plasmodium vivax]|nr:protein KIC9, putative [Plasmodium vivax]